MAEFNFVYGTMGGGKTNYVVNKILAETKYKRVITNIQVLPLFYDTFPNQKNLEIIYKEKPLEVILSVTPENPSTLIIIDEIQRAITEQSVQVIKHFLVQLGDIRQNDQEVWAITQTSKAIPEPIRDLANHCYKCVNQGFKGVNKVSKITRYTGGTDYETQKEESFVFSHIYGTYKSFNVEQTVKPKMTLKGVYIKLGLLIFVIVVIFGWLAYKAYNFVFSRVNPKQEITLEQQKLHDDITEAVKQVYSSELCYRSIDCNSHSICTVIYSNGYLDALPASKVMDLQRCPSYVSKSSLPDSNSRPSRFLAR